MGAKTGMLVYSQGDAVAALKGRLAADPVAAAESVARLRPGWRAVPVGEGNLEEDVYPPEGLAYVGCFPDLEVMCDRRVMLDRPSSLEEHLVAASRGRRLVLHAMHSVVDWLAYALWEDGRLVRSLSLAPDGGVIEDIGEPLPFEASYWAGDHAVPFEPEWGEEPYPLPFHPLELGEEALRFFFGFVYEGRRLLDDVDPERVPLIGFRLTEPG